MAPTKSALPHKDRIIKRSNMPRKVKNLPKRPRRRLRRRRRQPNMVVKAPVAIGVKTRRISPKVFRISHKEYIGSISYESADFTVEAYQINPGNIKSFPWVSQIANSFESFKLVSQRYEYRPTTSTTTTGNIMMAIDYDPDDDLPTDEFSLLANASVVQTVPWSPNSIPVDLKNLRNRQSKLFVARHGQEDRFTSAGQLLFAASGVTETAQIGQLYCHYVIEFYTPQVDSSSMDDEVIYNFTAAAGNVNNVFQNVTTASQLDSPPFTATGTKELTCNISGEYLITIDVVPVNVLDTLDSNLLVNFVSESSAQLNDPAIVLRKADLMTWQGSFRMIKGDVIEFSAISMTAGAGGNVLCYVRTRRLDQRSAFLSHPGGF